jgi:hypothetical protein
MALLPRIIFNFTVCTLQPLSKEKLGSILTKFGLA